jgi:hypothetical protein
VWFAVITMGMERILPGQGRVPEPPPADSDALLMRYYGVTDKPWPILVVYISAKADFEALEHDLDGAERRMAARASLAAADFRGIIRALRSLPRTTDRQASSTYGGYEVRGTTGVKVSACYLEAASAKQLLEIILRTLPANDTTVRPAAEASLRRLSSVPR